MNLSAGKLRHRVDIEKLTITQDSTTGENIKAWSVLYKNVPAAIEPLSSREFIQSSAMQSQVIARIVIRYRSGLDASMRINHNGTIYNPQGFLADKDSGKDYLTIPVTTGVNDG